MSIREIYAKRKLSRRKTMVLACLFDALGFGVTLLAFLFVGLTYFLIFYEGDDMKNRTLAAQSSQAQAQGLLATAKLVRTLAPPEKQGEADKSIALLEKEVEKAKGLEKFYNGLFINYKTLMASGSYLIYVLMLTVAGGFFVLSFILAAVEVLVEEKYLVGVLGFAALGVAMLIGFCIYAKVSSEADQDAAATAVNLFQKAQEEGATAAPTK